MSAIVLAAALTGAVINQGAMMPLLESYPTDAKSSGAGVEFAVSPEGRVSTCKPIASYGGEALAAALCKRLSGTSATPARDAAGARAWGVVQVFVQRARRGSHAESWNIGSRPELELAVSGTVISEAERVVSINLQVDGAGAVTGCSGSTGISSALADAACGEASKLALGNADVPGGYVRSVAIRFIASRG